MPLHLSLYNGCWLLGDVLCLVYIYVGYIVVGVSWSNMVLISADRYLAICDPMFYQTKVTVGRVQVCICFCWIYCIVQVSCALRDSLIQPGMYNKCVGECVVLMNPEEGIVDVFISFIVPFTTITVLYTRIFVVAVSQARAIRSQIATHCKKAFQRSGFMAKKSEMKAAKTLGILVLVFLVLSLPYYGYIIGREGNTLSLNSGHLETWLIYFNSSINPVIYVLSYPWFRTSVKHIVTLQIFRSHSQNNKIISNQM